MGRCGEIQYGWETITEAARITPMYGERGIATQQTANDSRDVSLPPQALKHGGIAGMINELAH